MKHPDTIASQRAPGSGVRHVLCAVLFAACAAVDEGTPTRWLVAPLVDPTRVRFETVIFEMPLERAEAHYRPADPRSATVGVSIDEAGSRVELSELATHASDVVRADRTPVEIAPGSMAAIPARVPTPALPLRALASDSLSLTVMPTVSYGFTPFELDLSFVWSDARGKRLGQFTGKTPVPADYWMRIVCLPSQERGRLGAQDTVPAIIAFVLMAPVYEDVVIGRLDAHEGLATEHGALENVGDDTIEYSITGDRRIAAVALGARGNARWKGDGAAFSVTGGAASRLRCIGDANRLRVLGDAQIERRSIELLGRDNSLSDERRD